ncbi:MAG TPA: hypothetical protein VL860_10885, partial [Planctomycetota bacterium]|nr:hypothetical protein [Planctomycetota bacterium]
IVLGACLLFLLYHNNTRQVFLTENRWYGWPCAYVMHQIVAAESFDWNLSNFSWSYFLIDLACALTTGALLVGLLWLVWPRAIEEIESTGAWDERKGG